MILKSRNINAVVFLILFFSCMYSVSAFAQENELTGIVKDSLFRPIGYAMVLATPLESTAESLSSTTSSNGTFNFALSTNVKYSLSVSFLGFKTYTDTIQLNSPQYIDITLLAQNILVKEVFVKEMRLPIRIAQDSVIYTVDSFLDGNERKLRHLLDKLPGLEVERDGSLFFNGKKVTKLLVDGKPFFNGNSKLGVNNIPSEVVEKVEILKNYSEISLLKDFQNNDAIAINIELKEDKKKFIFGDVEAGVGVRNRYVFHPSVFYYKPKTNLNFIGDLNNNGMKSFTFKDYLEFEGGMSDLFSNPSKFSELAASDFAKALVTNNSFYRDDHFGAINVSQEINSRTNLRVYSINNSSTNKENALSYNVYNSPGSNRLVEQQSVDNKDRSILSINKLEFDYNRKKLDVRLKTNYRYNNLESFRVVRSAVNVDTSLIDDQSIPTEKYFSQSIFLNKKFSTKNLLSINCNFQSQIESWFHLMSFSKNPFPALIPLVNSNVFEVISHEAERKKVLLFEFGDYWKINPKHHLFTSIGFNANRQYFGVDFHQILNDSLVPLQDRALNNQLQFDLLDAYGVIKYTLKMGRFQFLSGFDFHAYKWYVNQNNMDVRRFRSKILPSFSIDWDVNSAQSLKLKYQSLASFNNVKSYSNRLNWTSWNNLEKGSEFLENELSQKVTITYSRAKLFKAYSLNISADYSWVSNPIRKQLELEKLYLVNTLVQNHRLEQLFMGSIRYSKKYKKLQLNLKNRTRSLKYSFDFNGVISDYVSVTNGTDIFVKTRSKLQPNLKVGVRYQQSGSWLSTNKTSNSSVVEPYCGIGYWFFKKINFVMDYEFYNYINQKTKSKINLHKLNAYLKFDNTDSPWSFKLGLTNAFGNSFKVQQTISNMVVSDYRESVQPRIIMGSIIYKL